MPTDDELTRSAPRLKLESVRRTIASGYARLQEMKSAILALNTGSDDAYALVAECARLAEALYAAIGGAVLELYSVVLSEDDDANAPMPLASDVAEVMFTILRKTLAWTDAHPHEIKRAGRLLDYWNLREQVRLAAPADRVTKRVIKEHVEVAMQQDKDKVAREIADNARKQVSRAHTRLIRSALAIVVVTLSFIAIAGYVTARELRREVVGIRGRLDDADKRTKTVSATIDRMLPKQEELLKNIAKVGDLDRTVTTLLQKTEESEWDVLEEINKLKRDVVPFIVAAQREMGITAATKDKSKSVSAWFQKQTKQTQTMYAALGANDNDFTVRFDELVRASKDSKFTSDVLRETLGISGADARAAAAALKQKVDVWSGVTSLGDRVTSLGTTISDAKIVSDAIANGLGKPSNLAAAVTAWASELTTTRLDDRIDAKLATALTWKDVRQHLRLQDTASSTDEQLVKNWLTKVAANLPL